jgi:hypothetical protein
MARKIMLICTSEKKNFCEKAAESPNLLEEARENNHSAQARPAVIPGQPEGLSRE